MSSYGTRLGVEAINSHFSGGYTSATLPTDTAVSAWLAEGYAHINVALAKAGYTVPASSSATCYSVLTRLNNLYAAACAEQAVNIGATGETETRADKLWTQYKDGLKDLLDGDLTLAGLTHVATAPVRRSIRSLQMRHYDGFAVNADEADASTTGEYT